MLPLQEVYDPEVAGVNGSEPGYPRFSYATLLRICHTTDLAAHTGYDLRLARVHQRVRAREPSQSGSHLVIPGARKPWKLRPPTQSRCCLLIADS